MDPDEVAEEAGVPGQVLAVTFEEGSGLEPFAVRTVNKDYLRWDKTPPARRGGVKNFQDAPFLFATFLAWSAARRLELTRLDVRPVRRARRERGAQVGGGRPPYPVGSRARLVIRAALAAEQSIAEAWEWDDATLATVLAELAERAERNEGGPTWPVKSATLAIDCQ